jgi:hypothetical protein
LVPSARIEATNTETSLKRSAESNREGLYVLPNLPPGRYRVQVQAEGFESVIQDNVVLRVQDIVTQNYSLKVGAVSASITVEGGAPLVQAESAAVGTVVDRRFVENMPLNGRSLQTLITLVPGVVPSTSPGQFSVNGQRGNSNYFSIDGVSGNFATDVNLNPVSISGGVGAFNALGGTNSLVSVDGLEEFRIQTSTFSAEYGRTPGGQITLATRAGTKTLHGTGSEYLRNDILDAADWFVNSHGLQKPPLRQNDFGGTLGGPIPLPQSFPGRGRTFFFLTYEGLRLRTPVAGVANVPSLDLRQQVSPSLQNVLNAYPKPTASSTKDGVGLFPYAYSNPSGLNAGSGRFDYAPTDRLLTFIRFNIAPSQSATRDLARLSTTEGNIRTLTAGVTTLISPKVNSNMHINYSTDEAAFGASLNTMGGAVPLQTSSFLPPAFDPSTSYDTFSMFSIGFNPLLVGNRNGSMQKQFNVTDTTAWILGRNEMKAGIDYRDLRSEVSPILQSATFMFSSINSVRNGVVDMLTVNTGERYYPLYRNLSLFVQDRFRVMPHLTLELGLRWDINFAPEETSGKHTTVLTDPGNPATTAIDTSKSVPYETPLKNLAPRLGLAYTAAGSPGRELVVRAGAGLFYDLGTGPASLTFSGYPFMRTQALPSVPFPPTVQQLTPPPPGAIPASGVVVYGYASDFRTPVTYQWNFALEQALGANQKLTVTYLGAAGKYLTSTLNYQSINPKVPRLAIVGNQASSTYHAMQVQFQRRLSRGVQALTSYSWSHAIDAMSDEGASTLPLKASADFDYRHVLSQAISYDLPAPFARAKLAHVFQQWSLDTLLKLQSAAPVDLSTVTGTINGQNTVVRPDLVLGQPIYLTDPNVPAGRRLNPGAFLRAPNGRQGTLGRNAVRAFPLSQLDISLRRQFQLVEGVRLSIRADAFNVLNHPNFGPPSNPATSTGQASFMASSRSLLNPLYSVGGPRSMQLSLKVQF